MSKQPKELYRPGVGVMLLNKKGLVFVGRRRDIQGKAWQMPQGGIDAVECPRTAAFRELWEETGITSVEVIHESPEELYYEFPPLISEKLWGGRYKGQRHYWFLMRFVGNDNEINLNVHNEAEFLAYKWVKPATLIDTIVDFKKDLYQQVLNEFVTFL